MITGAFIGFIICSFLFILLGALAICDNNIDRDSVGVGVALSFLLLFVIMLGVTAFEKDEIYYNKYEFKTENIKEY